ncbi:MAG: fumarylacetoacetate hydrolase family protein, partial [Alphaproteobacteria bacterium]
MKLLRYGTAGAEKPGLMDADGHVRDLSGVIDDFDAAALSPEGLQRLAAIDPVTLPQAPDSVRLGPPIPRPGCFIGIGLNYADHAEEAGLPIPEQPIVFMKATSCLSGPNDDILVPRGSDKLDYEVEFGFVIGTGGRYIRKEDAWDHIAGYTLVNDVSERTFQIDRGGLWNKGKCFDTFGPVGPFLVTKDELDDPLNHPLKAVVNGEVRQDGTTATMIFDIPTIIEHLSQYQTLEPGDLIATGTPPGVGMGFKPPK